MRETASDRWASIVLAVLLHAGVVGLLAYGWFTMRDRPKPTPAATLAIEATVVDSSTLDVAPRTTLPKDPAPPVKEPQPEPAPEPPAPPPEPVPEPEPEPEPQGPTPEEIAQKERAERDAAEKAEAERKERLEQQRVAAEKAEAERRKREEAERAAQAKREAEARRVAEEKRQADVKRQAELRRQQEEERQRGERESDLRANLEAEQRRMAARSSGALNQWVAQITAKIQRAWIRPPSARPGLDCTIEVTQIPGGEVTNVRLAECNGDQAVRESIEAAVFRASPLPPPPDPSLFERNLVVRFLPTD